MSSEFYTGELNGHSKDEDNEEERVIKEVTENVDFC